MTKVLLIEDDAETAGESSPNWPIADLRCNGRPTGSTVSTKARDVRRMP